MENIKKMILSVNDDKTINKIIVVKEDKIERYYSKDLSQEALRKIYLVNRKVLFEEQAEILKELSDEEKDNKLASLQMIVRNEDNLIVGITEYEEPVKFVVTYEDGQKEYNEDDMDISEYMDKYVNTLKNICNTYGIKITDTDTMIEDLKKLDLYSKHEEKNIEQENKPLLQTIIKENKISNLSVKKKWILGILGTGALVLIASRVVGSLNNKNDKDDNSNKTTIELATEAPTPTPYTENIQEVPFLILEEPTVEPTVFIPTSTPYAMNKEIYFENEENIFPDYVEPINETLLIKDVADTNYYSLEQTDFNIIELRNQNMDSLENKTQSDISLTDQGYYIYYENLFNNTYDKAFVKYFSMFGNQIIKCGYVDDNFSYNAGVNNYAIKSCYEVVRCIRDNQPISVYINGEREDLYYSNLSYEAKNTILNIAWSNYTILNSNPELYKLSDYHEEANIPEINYNGEVLTKSDIADILITAYEELSMTK